MVLSYWAIMHCAGEPREQSLALASIVTALGLTSIKRAMSALRIGRLKSSQNPLIPFPAQLLDGPLSFSNLKFQD
jgi:hypothetical protein